MWPFHTHEWEVRTGSGFGRASAMRRCLSCPKIQTFLYDISKGEEVWVDGNFLESPDSPVFIIAESHESLKEALQYKPDGAGYFPVYTRYDFELMAKYRSPRFILARDWKESTVAELDSFRMFLMTGHF